MVWFLGSLRQPILALEPSSGGEIFGKLRLCTTRYFHQVRNCTFFNSNVIENMRALAKLENLSKNVKSPLKFTDSSMLFFHKFNISKPSARIEMDALINHKQSHLSKLLEHQSVQLILGCRCREEKIIEGHSSVHFELFLELESAVVFCDFEVCEAFELPFHVKSHYRTRKQAQMV